MMKLPLQALLVWAIAAPWAATVMSSAQSPQVDDIAVWAARLERKVARADRDAYLPIDSPWRNPTVFLDLDGIFIRSGDQAPGKTTDLSVLAKDLASLPVSAWPQGRVVVLAHSARSFPLIQVLDGAEPRRPSDPRVEAPPPWDVLPGRHYLRNK